MQLSAVMLKRCFLIIVTFLTLQTEVSGFRSVRSICTRAVRQYDTRWVSYHETYKKRVFGIFWKTATRINYRRESYFKWVSLTECCSGFSELTKTPLTCYPTCPTGCPHGECTQPNICTCLPGYRNPSTQDLSSCVPDCDGNADDPKSCGEYGRCIAPQKCKCDEGYTETIYTGTNSVTCEPKCEPACGLRGFCYKPNECRCDAGYRLALPKIHSRFQECEPICENDCVNGVCQSPNNCSCLPGYKQHTMNYFLCEPVCNNDCINANCTEPDHCECYVGFEKNEFNPPGMCSPICDQKCINAACTRPNHCECHRGYEMIPNYSNSTCAPICNPPCINAMCTQPDTCECHIGYEKNPNRPHNECSPICDPPCINGECTQPNHCECHHRYKTDPDHPEVCLPVCDPPCTNAVCVQPDTCKCLNGYEKSTEDHSQICSPICDPPCINADCSRPNHCECHHGYELNPPGPFHECLPVCDPPCTNAICYEPNLCQCNDGYKNSLTDPSQYCSPVCDPACDSNGFCESPNKCTCNYGYIETDSIANSTFKNSIICQPFCQPECNKNASCVAPNLCRCNPGYQPVFLSDQVSNPTQCLPICEKNCLNGFCGYPNKCVCHLGYKMSQVDKFQCEPHCAQDCINAKCTGPNYCECFDDYVKTKFVQTELHHNSSTADNICIPRCSENCLSCIAPNECTCHPGYVLKDSVTNPFSQSCQPLCEPTCPNGLECIAPNQCQSPAGHNQDDHKSLTTEAGIFNSTENYPNSGNFFMENGTCICKAGWFGSGCDEPIFCIMRFTADNETDNQFYTMLSDAIENNQIKDEADYEEADEMLGWQAPKCNEDCRISILELDTKNFSDKIIRCHREILSNVINDSVTTKDPSLASDINNASIACFIKAESECSTPKTQVTSVHGSLYEISGTIGSGIFVVILTLVGLISFIVFQKKRNAKGSHAVSQSNSIMTEWTDDPDHNRNLETSTL